MNEVDDMENDPAPNFDNNEIPQEANFILNSPITEDEIKKVVSNLKNGKAFGVDEVLNEYIKSTVADLLPIYVKLFNLILDTGFVPEIWSTGIMITIYKNKSSKSDPDMHRGITLNSCFS